MIINTQLDSEDDEDDDDFDVMRVEKEDDETVRKQSKDKKSNEDSHLEVDRLSRRSCGLRLTRNEYHRFCDTQLKCKFFYDLYSIL